MAPSDALPDADLAARIGSDATGRRAIGASRFTTGAAHYVFEVMFAAQPSTIFFGNGLASESTSRSTGRGKRLTFLKSRQPRTPSLQHPKSCRAS